MTVLTTVSVYGEQGASYRIRVREWLLWLGLAADEHVYLDRGSSSPGLLLRHAAGAVAVEKRLRVLAASSPDVLLLHREASPLSRGGLERRLLQRARVGVYDFDDALQWDHGAGHRARRLAPKADKCLAAARSAGRVLAGNTVLADWASEWARDVVVVPSCVDPERYSVRSDPQVQDPPRLGWLGSPTTERYLVGIAPALREIHRRTGARVTVISAGKARLPGLEDLVDRVRWTPDGQADALRGIDVALAPLEDTVYARGKCAYKLLQYAAAGLPLVASPVGVNRQVTDILGGAPASTQEDWVVQVNRLLTLAGDSRQQIAEQARKGVERHFSFAAWQPVMQRALELSAAEPLPVAS